MKWYRDPLPTNCVGDWICEGYKHPDCHNLAVFYESCTMNCLFCQNWHFRYETPRSHFRTAQELAASVDDRTACICYFGGDPAPQLPFALRAARLARHRNANRILRICWETNGAAHPGFIDSMADMALESGGCVKFDLKAWDPNLHQALTGVSNRRTIENFERIAGRIRRRPVPPLLVASTLVVPGYIDEQEVGNIARFIAGIDPEIPYSLLGFYPHYHMADLPVTSRSLAERCLETAWRAGLKNVRLGNEHLLR